MTDQDLSTILKSGVSQKLFEEFINSNDDAWRSISDYCQNHSPEPDVLQWVINRMYGDGQISELKSPQIRTLILGLQDNHRYYRSRALPQIGQSFVLSVTHNPNNLYLNLCEQLFNQFATALNVHIKAEEDLFEAVLKGDFSPTDLVEEDHHDETEALSKIIGMLEKVLNPKEYDPCSILSAQLRNLENDLKVHGFIEEEILFPLLKK